MSGVKWKKVGSEKVTGKSENVCGLAAFESAVRPVQFLRQLGTTHVTGTSNALIEIRTCVVGRTTDDKGKFEQYG